MTRAVIFDIDGTLLDSVDLHAKAWQDAFAHFGHDVSFDAVRSQIGKGGDQLLPVFLSKDEIEHRGKEIEKFRGDLFKKNYLPLVKPFPKVRELLEAVRDRGQKIALASSAKADEIETYKKIAGISDLVEEQTTSGDVSRSKPFPDIFEAALEQLGPGVEAAGAVIVGDSPYDAQAASGAGIRCVGVLCGGFPALELFNAGCLAVYRDPADLLARYDSSELRP